MPDNLWYRLLKPIVLKLDMQVVADFLYVLQYIMYQWTCLAGERTPSTTGAGTSAVPNTSPQSTHVRVPRVVCERVEAVAPHLYEQDRLSEL